MPASRPACPAAFKQRMVAWARAGCTPARALITLILCLVPLLSTAQTPDAADGRTYQFEGMTFDLFLSGQPRDSTVVYFPGCNGRDDFGALYQDFHVEKLRQAWSGRVNIVRVQLVNDATLGAVNGLCFWSAEEMSRKGVSTLDFARKVGRLAQAWIASQPWFNGKLHFFGFSYGGRVSMMVNSVAATRGQFTSVTGIWPMCRPEQAFRSNRPHTPTRLYSTLDDPLSHISNCPSFYPEEGAPVLEIITYPGDRHSWMTHPSVKNRRVWWPNHRIWSTGDYIEEYAQRTWQGWVAWARCLEQSAGSCRGS